MGETFERDVMWRKFVSLKNFLDREWRSRHLQVIISLKVYHAWCETILYLLVNTKTLMMFVCHTRDFTNGITITYLTYCTHYQMDVCFL